MIEVAINGLKLWQFSNLNAFPAIGHYVSGRAGGVSSEALGKLNLSFKVSDARENVLENRRLLADALELSADRLYFPSQTHGINVRQVFASSRSEELEDTDALVTNVPGICISVMSADCVPILLYDPVNQAVGAVHAGWRGTVGKILIQTCEQMARSFGTKASDLVAGIGPSICQEVYEVGEEVQREVERAFPDAWQQGLLKAGKVPGKSHVDLWLANKLQLLEAGVPQASIEVSAICTYTHAEAFFSARRSGNRAGRFAAGIFVRQ